MVTKFDICNKSNTISEICQKNITNLLVRFNSDAQRSEKSRSYVHGKQSHGLQWNITHYLVHTSHASHKHVEQVAYFSSTQQSLYNHRKYACADVSEHAWYRSHRNNSAAQTQWCLSVSCRNPCIPESDNVSTILTTHFTRWNSETPIGTITVVNTDVREASSRKETILDMDSTVLVLYDHEIIEKFEEDPSRLFTIAAKLASLTKRRLSSLRYHGPTLGIETAEFFYQPVRWKKRYRFIVIRRSISEEPTE